GVLADGQRVLEQDLAVAGRRPGLEHDVGLEVALVVVVEVDLENAADVRLVVWVVVEGDAVDLDGAVVAARPLLGSRRSGQRQREAGASGRRRDGTECPRPPHVSQLPSCRPPLAGRDLSRTWSAGYRNGNVI